MLAEPMVASGCDFTLALAMVASGCEYTLALAMSARILSTFWVRHVYNRNRG